MTLIDPANRPFIECPRCMGPIILPASPTDAQRADFAELARTDSMQAIRHARDVFDLDIREAKALTLHVTLVIGKCHRCGLAVTDRESICTKCNSVNLDW